MPVTLVELKRTYYILWSLTYSVQHEMNGIPGIVRTPMEGRTNMKEDLQAVFAILDEKKFTYDTEKVSRDFQRLIDEFMVPPEEAKRTILEQAFRENGCTDRYKSTGGQAETMAITNFKANDWVNFVAIASVVRKGRSEAIGQTGVLQDATGTIRFTIWAKAGVLLEEGKTYQFENAVVDEYRGALSLKVHSGTTVIEVPGIPVEDSIAQVGTLVAGDLATVEVRCVKLFDTVNDKILQSGIVGDETGTIKFTVWKNGSDGFDPLIENGCYQIRFAPVDSWQDKLSITLNDAVVLGIDKEIEARNATSTLNGVITMVREGSGLIRRCGEQGCNRTLNRMMICPIHMRQETFKYDLRIKANVDNGEESVSAIIGRELTEQLVGMTMDEAIELSKSHPLGLEQVFYDVRAKLTGRYVCIEGSKLPDAFLVNGAELIVVDDETAMSVRNMLVERADNYLTESAS